MPENITKQRKVHVTCTGNGENMKRTVAVLLALITVLSLLILSSCGKDDSAPEDMQLVRGGEKYGYYFYGPEEWVVANLGDIACTYASKVDMSSMTFTETEKPSISIREYFESERHMFPYEITVTVDGESCAFGNADKLATKYVYTYTYKEKSYTCMQVFVENKDAFYIFTYTASNLDYSAEETYYQLYLEKVSKVMDEFKFVEKSKGDEERVEYEKDSDGYILVSDKTLAGFKMYVPDSYRVDYSSVLVSVSHPSGANITMSQATYTGVDANSYFEARKESINAICDKTYDPVSGEKVSTFTEIEKAKQIELAGTSWALAYEYTYVFEGTPLHVYQVLIVEGSYNGYVFTYTADEECYGAHLSEAMNILGKIEY